MSGLANTPKDTSTTNILAMMEGGFIIVLPPKNSSRISKHCLHLNVESEFMEEMQMSPIGIEELHLMQ